MADTKSGTIRSITSYHKRDLHQQESSGSTGTAVTGTFPAKVPMADQIKKYRKEAKISQQSLADQLNVTRNTVINWEAGKYRPDADLFPKLKDRPFELITQAGFRMRNERNLLNESLVAAMAVHLMQRVNKMNFPNPSHR